MLDIALIRQKPDWVKEQIGKLNDEGAVDRIDRVLQLDWQRRDLRTRIETSKASLNRLNRGMGKLRGNRTIDEEEKLERAVLAAFCLTELSDHEAASEWMECTVPRLHYTDERERRRGHESTWRRRSSFLMTGKNLRAFS